MDTQQDRRDMDIGLNQINQEELDRKPWKYIGYKGFVEYSSLTDEIFVVRRFDYLHCRNILVMQQKITTLEKELRELDEQLIRKTPDIDNGTVNSDCQQRLDLLDKITKELKVYDGAVLSYKQLKSAPIASKRNIQNINIWLANANHPIEAAEVEYLKTADLITVTTYQKSWLRLRFEQLILGPTGGLFGLLGLRDGPEDTIRYWRDEPVDAIATVSFFFMSMSMLVAPLWVLAKMKNMDECLGVITACILILLGVITLGTSAKPCEILAITAV
ncbi:hypothetical protein PG985_004919 [Apiospora marii]|uniref:uncharacterized protein n=1 Tax=Apiospora marii TaxID=335849 RepID=UPI00312F464C